MSLRMVVFPQPYGPMRQMNSLRATLNETLSSASVTPWRTGKRLHTSRTRICGAAIGEFVPPPFIPTAVWASTVLRRSSVFRS